MIELHLTQITGGTWELTATILPLGGLGGLAREATVATVHEGTFRAASDATTELDLSALSFTSNPDRWPVPEPKFQIVNELSHPERDTFGNYQIRRGDAIVGRLENFPRGDCGELIKEALRVVAAVENHRTSPDTWHRATLCSKATD